MKQQTLAVATGFERYTKKTKRALFLEEMEQVVPWAELCALIEPVYPKAGNGRPPVGVERMLRLYFVQQWFNLSDPAMEKTLYDSAVLFAGAAGVAAWRRDTGVGRPGVSRAEGGSMTLSSFVLELVCLGAGWSYPQC